MAYGIRSGASFVNCRIQQQNGYTDPAIVVNSTLTSQTAYFTNCTFNINPFTGNVVNAYGKQSCNIAKDNFTYPTLSANQTWTGANAFSSQINANAGLSVIGALTASSITCNNSPFGSYENLSTGIEFYMSEHEVLYLNVSTSAVVNYVLDFATFGEGYYQYVKNIGSNNITVVYDPDGSYGGTLPYVSIFTLKPNEQYKLICTNALTNTWSYSPCNKLAINSNINVANATTSGIISQSDWIRFNTASTSGGGTTYSSSSGSGIIISGSNITADYTKLASASNVVANTASITKLQTTFANSTTSGLLSQSDWVRFNTATVIYPDASATTSGLVNITTQTFAGAKTFNGVTTVSVPSASQALIVNADSGDTVMSFKSNGTLKNYFGTTGNNFFFLTYASGNYLFYNNTGSSVLFNLRQSADASFLGTLMVGSAAIASAQLNVKGIASAVGVRIDQTSGTADLFQTFATNGTSKLTYIDYLGRTTITDTTVASSSSGALQVSGGINAGNIYTPSLTVSGTSFHANDIVFTASKKLKMYDASSYITVADVNGTNINGNDLCIAGGIGTGSGFGGGVCIRNSIASSSGSTLHSSSIYSAIFKKESTSLIPDNVSLFSSTANFNGAFGVTYVANVATLPTGNPTGGGYFYSQGGALKWMGSSGTITTVAPA